MRQIEQIMGMPITVEIVGDQGRMESAFEAVFSHFRQIDAVYSPYKSDSVVSRLDRGEMDIGDCSREVQEVFAACALAKQRSGGYFDIFHQGHTDPSGYVKGWSIGQAASLLRDRDCKDFFIEAGGDVQVSGHNREGLPWRVGLKHPKQQGKFAKVVRLVDAAIATSGSYERGQHIYNPHTGVAVDDPISLSVIGRDITEADVLATTAFAMGPTAGLKFVASAGLEGYAVCSNLEVLATPGFSSYVE